MNQSENSLEQKIQQVQKPFGGFIEAAIDIIRPSHGLEPRKKTVFGSLVVSSANLAVLSHYNADWYWALAQVVLFLIAAIIIVFSGN